MKNGKVYVSISDIASLVGYGAHNGEYKLNIENDTDKMYVDCKDETASFFYGEAVVKKVAPNSNDSYDIITISEPVIRQNGKLYVISDGFSVGFNSAFNYNAKKNTITISTLPNLVAAYSAVITQYDFAKITDEFTNQKALIYGLVVGARDDDKLGVKTTENNEILSPRYNNIEFVESAGEFIVTNSSNKVGIMYSTGSPKIEVAYDQIKVINSSLGLYLVKSNNKYGVIDSNDNAIIPIEYSQIGITISNYPKDNINNQYILFNNIIPAKINNAWLLFDINGKRLTTEQYAEVGFTNASTFKDTRINNAIAIGNTGAIVVGKLKTNGINTKDSVYGAVDVKGNTLIPIMYDAIYAYTDSDSGVTSYKIFANSKEYDAIQLIDAIKKQLGYEEENVQEETTGQELNNNAQSGTNNTLNAEKASNENTAVKVQNTNTVQTSTQSVTTQTSVTSNSVTN